ncbi:VOC family protein [Arthrobacter sp. CDRTa11]|uniref:VOC family protein n=1 Tax=Arthrobacter sp. CDRTa11 TaxID=2651199 RepID=UPI002B3FFF0D|nr:VOC family protein [Arthrobacter sp. CDRTa11]
MDGMEKAPSQKHLDTPDPTEAVTGTYTTGGIPHGSTSLTPHLVVDPAAEALAFYETVFGARVLDTTRFPGGDLMAHAVLDFGSGLLTLSDPLEEYQLAAPTLGAGSSFSLAVYVPDTDEAVRLAISLGATVREPAMTFVTGDRFASILDPFGVRWSVMTRVIDLSPEESKRRVQEWAGQQSSS